MATTLKVYVSDGDGQDLPNCDLVLIGRDDNGIVFHLACAKDGSFSMGKFSDDELVEFEGNGSQSTFESEISTRIENFAKLASSDDGDEIFKTRTNMPLRNAFGVALKIAVDKKVEDIDVN